MSKVKIELYASEIKKLEAAAVKALEETADGLHTEIVQAQVMPFDDPRVEEKKVYGKRGQFAKNGREYKGKIVREKVHGGGHLQNDSTFIDCSTSKQGIVYLSSSTPYARRLYFHPEYHFDTGENPNAKGKWLEDWLPGGKHSDFCQTAFNQIFKKEANL